MKFLSAVLAVAVFGLSWTSQANAESEFLTVAGKRGKIVAKSAAYGFGGGLVVGLASQVFKKKTKNIFLFGSLGMYAGIALGIYVISTSKGPTPYEGPDTYDDYGDYQGKIESAPSSTLLAQENGGFARNSVELKFLNFDF